MPIQCVWGNAEQTVLLLVFEGNITIEDYYTAIDTNYQMISAVGHTVHTIQDTTKRRTYPTNFIQLFRYAERKIPANQGMRFTTTHNAFIRHMIEIARRIAPHFLKEVYFVATVEDAYRIIAERSTPAKQV